MNLPSEQVATPVWLRYSPAMKRLALWLPLLFLGCIQMFDTGPPDLAGDAAMLPGPPEDLVAPDAAAPDLPGKPTDLRTPQDAAADASSGCPPGGTLRPGQSFTVGIDAFTGDEAMTQPKSDANDGRNGDSVYFQRRNVARGHLDYWFTSKHQEAGEPDPRGDQWVDYRPPLTTLGAGRYRITGQYRQTDNRASYDALYIVTHRGGMTTLHRDQRVGTGYVDVDLGEFDLGCTGWVRVQDTGADSISFNKMVFRFIGP